MNCFNEYDIESQERLNSIKFTNCYSQFILAHIIGQVAADYGVYGYVIPASKMRIDYQNPIYNKS